jgi:hypothetical protein
VKGVAGLCPYTIRLWCALRTSLSPSVADPHHFDADPDPDPAFHFDANPDPDPTFHSDANPDLDPGTHFFPDLDPPML